MSVDTVQRAGGRMIDEADRARAERLAWWMLADMMRARTRTTLKGAVELRKSGVSSTDAIGMALAARPRPDHSTDAWFQSFDQEQPPARLPDVEADELLGRVWRRMQECKAGADFEPSVEDYAEWIGYDLGGVFETSGKLTAMLVERAIEHGRGLPE